MSGRILVIDDIATNRVILKAKLSAAYYDVIQADSGDDGIAMAKSAGPDLIMLSAAMHGRDGFDICTALKSDLATADLPVIMVIAGDGDHGGLDALRRGADDFLIRPFDDLALFCRVRNLLRGKFMLDELRLREDTACALGLATRDTKKGADDPQTRGRVVLVPDSPATGRGWSAALAANLPDQDIRVLDVTEARALRGQDLPDVFVIHSQLAAYGDGLRLLSQLAGRQGTFRCAVILVLPDGHHDKAAQALDLGASDYIFDPVNPYELALRIKSQIRRKKMSDRLRSSVDATLRLAVQDPLTGLFNRRYVTGHLEKMSRRAATAGKPFVLMMLDIDNFKRVNDTRGHCAGDRVLVEFSTRIQENLRGIDLVSRLGGEEFLIAMPDTSEAEARIAGERLRKIVENTPFDQSGDHGLRVTVSIGVALGTGAHCNVAQLIDEADKALYISKSDGRNQVTLFPSAA